MQLTYRGIRYTPSVEVEAPKTARLIYRGVTIDRPLAPVSPVSPAIPATARPVLMVYRGVAYTRAAIPTVPSEKPGAINWRYQDA